MAKRWLAMACLCLGGCSTHPLVDLCDQFKPGHLYPNRVQPYGGTCIPQNPVLPPTPQIPPISTAPPTIRPPALGPGVIPPPIQPGGSLPPAGAPIIGPGVIPPPAPPTPRPF